MEVLTLTYREHTPGYNSREKPSANLRGVRLAYKSPRVTRRWRCMVLPRMLYSGDR